MNVTWQNQEPQTFFLDAPVQPYYVWFVIVIKSADKNYNYIAI